MRACVVGGAHARKLKHTQPWQRMLFAIIFQFTFIYSRVDATGHGDGDDLEQIKVLAKRSRPRCHQKTEQKSRLFVPRSAAHTNHLIPECLVLTWFETLEALPIRVR